MTTPAPLTVLIIDADADMRLYLRRCLQNHRIQERSIDILEATSGRAGLLVALSRAPDLIITDFSWPDLDRATFRRALRADERLGRVPVLAVSEEAPALLDADAVLATPFNAAQLHAAIRSLLHPPAA